METRISHLGNKSFTLRQRAINQKTGRVVCQAETVMVCYHLAEQSSTEIPAHYRAAIEAYEAKGSLE